MLSVQLFVLSLAVHASPAPRHSVPGLQDPALARPKAGVDQVSWSFTDEAKARGIDFSCTFGDERFSFILEDTGSGVAVFDHDGDGFVDIYFLNGRWLEGVSDPRSRAPGTARNRLYRNRGDATFEDVTDRAGVGDEGYGMGAVVGDFDNDGDEDLYVLNYGPNVMYVNNGDGTFVDRTAQLGLAGPGKLSGMVKWSVNGAFFDHDGDGDLDLYVANYLAFDPTFVDPDLPKEYPYPGPESYQGQASLLYRNDGSTFVDVTRESGLWNENGKTMGASLSDLDLDGDLDVFEAIDSMPNVLFRCDPEGRFEEIAMTAGVALNRMGAAMGSMHGSIGDVDNDGDFDLFVPNLEFGCFYLNLGKLQFEDQTSRLPIDPAHKGTGWGSSFVDFDNDMDLDLFVVLGGAFSLSPGESDRLLINDGKGGFSDASAGLGPHFAQMHVGRGAGFADFDNDGDVDFVVHRKEPGARPNLVINHLPPTRHWLILDLSGTRSNRDAVGAKVVLECGGVVQTREVMRGGSYLSQNDVRVHLGLGNHTKVDRLTVHWPSGHAQTIAVAKVDQILRITESTP